MWVSISPGQARHPFASYTSASPASACSSATIRPCSTPISMSAPDSRSARRALRTIRSTWDSLGLDVGGLDQRPPLVDLGLLMRGQRLRGLLLRRRNFLTESGQPLDDRWVGKRVHCGGRKLADYFR